MWGGRRPAREGGLHSAVHAINFTSKAHVTPGSQQRKLASERCWKLTPACDYGGTHAGHACPACVIDARYRRDMAPAVAAHQSRQVVCHHGIARDVGVGTQQQEQAQVQGLAGSKGSGNNIKHSRGSFRVAAASLPSTAASPGSLPAQRPLLAALPHAGCLSSPRPAHLYGAIRREADVVLGQRLAPPGIQPHVHRPAGRGARRLCWGQRQQAKPATTWQVLQQGWRSVTHQRPWASR
jgi:hypothetical protein